MQEHLITFEMSDAVMSRAVREDCIAVFREHAKPRDLILVLASTGVFALVVAAQSHWVWWLAGLPTVVFALLGAGWVVAYFWLPRKARSRLARLSNRTVRVELSDERLAFETAAERLEVAWGELKALRRRPNFWFICLESGARIPVPVAAVPEDAVTALEDRLATAAQSAEDAR